jgi:Rrf2 family transcriptional regulator, cysteine metabolism repressor
MKLSTKIRYGTRAILELAFRFGEGPIELKEIARSQEISIKYLEQVIIPLRTAGMVKSARGAKGGYSLAKPPSETCLFDVLEALEGPLYLVDCIKDSKYCRRSSSCVTRDIWSEVSDALHKVLKSITLEEMVRRKIEKENGDSPAYQI